MSHKQTIALGVTGSIAAYKSAELCSSLVKSGFDVVVIMTASAQKLIGRQTFLTLSKNPVIVDLWEVPQWQPAHIELAERADLLAVVPATANFMGKYAHGIADDALTTFALSHRKKVLLAPAMNPKMWSHPAVQSNYELLKQRDVSFVGPASGPVACGDDGVGRMEEVNSVFEVIKNLLKS